MNDPRKFWRRIALKLADHAQTLSPPPQQQWAAAMRNEIDYMPDDREALGWAAGCLRAALAERWRAVSVPDGVGVRVLLMIFLAALTFKDLFATVLTAAYRLGALAIAREMGRMTPGDDYSRLIPLMEGVPLWLHALWSTAAVLYLFTIIRLTASKTVSSIPVLLAIAFELVALWLERPVIDAIGVRANPNPSLIAQVAPLLIPVVLALYLSKMRRSIV